MLSLSIAEHHYTFFGSYGLAYLKLLLGLASLRFTLRFTAILKHKASSEYVSRRNQAPKVLLSLRTTTVFF